MKSKTPGPSGPRTAFTDSADETVNAGRAFARRLKSNDMCIGLVGELGTGKTHFVKGFLSCFGIPREAVSSPTFTLVNVYESRNLKLYHIDLYRINAGSDLDEAGITEYIHSPGIKLVEWFEKIKRRNFDYIQVEFEWIEKDRRLLRFNISKKHKKGIL